MTASNLSQSNPAKWSVLWGTAGQLIKKQELPIKKPLFGQPLEKMANSDTMANLDCLDWSVVFAQKRLAEIERPEQDADESRRSWYNSSGAVAWSNKMAGDPMRRSLRF